MTVFVIAAVLIALLVLGAVLRPLWHATPRVAAGAMASVAIVAGLLYLLVGTPRALDPSQHRAPETLADAVTQLEAELERDPNQPEGWRLLARARAAQGLREQAREAYAQAVKFAPDEPDVLAEAAEARALATQDRRFDDKAVAMLRHALEVHPMHQRARWFLGIAQRQAGQPAEAARTWEPLLGVVDAQTGSSLREQIDQARADAGLPPLPAFATAGPAASAPLLQVTVEISPELRPHLREGDVLFVMARPASGSPVPVAAKRLPVGSFPVTVALDDADSLMPTAKLSQTDAVEITARVSHRGDATRASGDLESAPRAATPKPGARHTLRIDRVVE